MKGLKVLSRGAVLHCRIQNLQLTADNHHKLWAELNQRLRAVTAQHELKVRHRDLQPADGDVSVSQACACCMLCCQASAH